MQPPQDVGTQVNAFRDFEWGQELLDYLGRRYGGACEEASKTMRAATYHQQILDDAQTQWTVFEGHVDKNFVHTAWFVPLTAASFYTYIAVPYEWNIGGDEVSKRKHREWMASLDTDERNKLTSFNEAFEVQARGFMKQSRIRVLIYACQVGSFLSFPANMCYHATVTAQRSKSSNHDVHAKDLLIVYPMENG
jgi:hypothetical protein